MEELKQLPEQLFQLTPWKTSVHSLWLGTSLSLRRNILPFVFPAKMDLKEACQLREMVKEALTAHPSFKDALYFALENLKPIEKQLLFETFPSMAASDSSSVGQALILDKSYHRLFGLNMQDHLTVRINDFDGEWEKSFNELMALEETLSTTLSFAFLEKFGYLTAAPIHAGTGFEAQFFLHLPLLLRKHPEKLFSKELSANIELSSLQGSSEEFLGDLVILKNANCIGINEAMSVKALFAAAMKLITFEEQERKALKEQIPQDIKDLISRAMALLLHSYELKAPETINALSLLKLGLDLGFVKGVSHETLNELFLQSQRAHLSLLKHLDATDEPKILSERATSIREKLKNLEHTP